MKNIEYTSLREIDRMELLKVLNKKKIREHLVSHDEFDEASLEKWIIEKTKVDSCKGCVVKGVKVDAYVAGWCGIQFENGTFELAIILDEEYWGIGISVFKDTMKWAYELGHSQIVLHLFNTRPEYKFLRKMASRIYESTMFGQKYISYELRVPRT
jgi:hypothetical protein